MLIVSSSYMVYGFVVNMKKKIAFIGDSFCNNYGLADWQKFSKMLPSPQNGTNDPTYTDLVVKHFNADILPYGFGGKSWWYSRNKFEKFWGRRFDQVNDTINDEVEAIVFCHTDSGRINNSWNDNFNSENSETENDSICESFFKHVYDPEFNEWAQEQWFREIARRYSHIKTVHFHCFSGTLRLSHLLPGVVFTTPLITISLGELTGTKKEILYQATVNETRFNHLNNHNNQALAKVIIDTIENYSPGQYDIPMEKFEINNPNADKYPVGKFWTK